jgi:prepilin-type N-terminal cleavage/methylation domain-containing protein
VAKSAKIPERRWSIMQKLRGGKGFTLVELLLVVIIVGILVGIAVPIYMGQQKKARATEARNFISGVLRGAQAYLQEKGAFPTSLDTNSITLVNSTFSVVLENLTYFNWWVTSTYSSITAAAWGKSETDVEGIAMSAWMNINGQSGWVESGI